MPYLKKIWIYGIYFWNNSADSLIHFGKNCNPTALYKVYLVHLTNLTSTSNSNSTTTIFCHCILSIDILTGQIILVLMILPTKQQQLHQIQFMPSLDKIVCKWLYNGNKDKKLGDENKERESRAVSFVSDHTDVLWESPVDQIKQHGANQSITRDTNTILCTNLHLYCTIHRKNVHGET